MKHLLYIVLKGGPSVECGVGVFVVVFLDLSSRRAQELTG